MQIVNLGRVSAATGIVYFTLTMLFTPVIADTANHQNKAKQSYTHSNNYQSLHTNVALDERKSQCCEDR